MTSEKKVLQISTERDNLQENIDQMAREYEFDIKNRELEKISSQRKVKQLQDELGQSNISLVQFAQNVQNINEKIYDVDKDVRVQYELKQRLVILQHTYFKMKEHILNFSLQKFSTNAARKYG